MEYELAERTAREQENKTGEQEAGRRKKTRGEASKVPK